MVASHSLAIGRTGAGKNATNRHLGNEKVTATQIDVDVMTTVTVTTVGARRQCPRTPQKKSLVVIFDNVLIPKSKNMAQSMAGFSKNPAMMILYDYTTEYRVKDKKGEWDMQCNCIVLVTVKKVEEEMQAKVEVETSYVDLFGIDSSQSQRSDDPPSPPRRCKKRCSEDKEDRHMVDDDDNDYDYNDGGGGGGKRGGGNSVGGGGGGGKCKKGF